MEDGKLAVDVTVFHIKLVAVAGRAVVFLARDASEKSDEASTFTVFSFYCESASVAAEIAANLSQVRSPPSSAQADAQRRERPL